MMRKSASFYFFKRKPVARKDRYELWRGAAELSGFNAQERLRVEWMVFYYTAAGGNATPDCPALWHLQENLPQVA